MSNNIDRAQQILEKRNQAFRVLYDTVFEVEGASDDEVITILCKNLRRISKAELAALGTYNPQARTIELKAISTDDNVYDCTIRDTEGIPISPDLLENFKQKQVQECNDHSNCWDSKTPSPVHFSLNPNHKRGSNECTNVDREVKPIEERTPLFPLSLIIFIKLICTES